LLILQAGFHTLQFKRSNDGKLEETKTKGGNKKKQKLSRREVG